MVLTGHPGAAEVAHHEERRRVSMHGPQVLRAVTDTGAEPRHDSDDVTPGVVELCQPDLTRSIRQRDLRRIAGKSPDRTTADRTPCLRPPDLLPDGAFFFAGTRCS